MKILLVFILCALTFPPMNAGGANRLDLSCPPKESTAFIESYIYEAVPLGDKNERLKESIEMKIFRNADGLFYNTKTISPNNVELINIRTDKDYGFISAEKMIYASPGKQLLRVDILRQADNIYVVKDGVSKVYGPLRNKAIAVDGSLLMLLRLFPFDKKESWDVFMIDFSRQSVLVKVECKGIETVSVPAGSFECYRIDVYPNLAIFHPKISYWLTKEMPHFLIKHTGKRGPFSRNYLTRLVSYSSEIKP